MTIAAKHFDPQLGIDIHLYEIPPSPVPIPLPTPHIGLVFDPFDYIPFIGGTVHVNGIKRATAGTGGLDVHIPVGGMWVPPMEVAEGPQYDDQLFMGSKTVVADGAPFSKLCMPVLDCNMVGMVPPLRLRKPKKPSLSLTLPTAVNLAIPTNVSVGGPPTIDMLGLLFQAGFAGALKGLKALKKLKRVESATAKFKAWRRTRFRDMPSGFLKCKVLRAEPVDIRDGSVTVEHEDFAIPGRLPLAWTRVYRSREHHDGLCGHGWHTPADLRLELDADGIAVFVDGERHVVFPQWPTADGLEHAVLELVDGARLYATGDEYRVRTKDGLIYAFRRPGGNVAPPDPQVLPIERIEDRCGNHWRFERTDGRLTRIQESGIDGLQGRFIDVVMQADRLHQLQLHDPATGLNHPLVSYDHDQAGDLVAAIDPLGAPRTFEYAEHHLVRHTDRTGLSFYYEYDARHQVIHAWGDGGLYDYRFRYDAQLQETEVTDSLGHVSLVKFDADGLPLCEIDPLDGVTVFEYDAVGRTTAVVDPEGLRTEFEYDERGNLLTLTRPDGGTVRMAYDGDDRRLACTRPDGAEERFAWNDQGLLATMTDPAGGTRHFAYTAQGQLRETTDPCGNATRLAFDRHGKVCRLEFPQGQVRQLESDSLGRTLRQWLGEGEAVRLGYDAGGRLLQVDYPDGRKLACTYDAEGRLTSHCDEAGAVTRLEYTGTDLLARRIQPDGSATEYRHDSEGRLQAVVNPNGETYRLVRDARGCVVEELDYWGQARRHERDLAGRIRRSIDALGRSVEMELDPMGRVLRKRMHDAPGKDPVQEESFRYDAEGRLLEARNAAAHVLRRYDPAGRLVREEINGFAVTSAYDAAGRRVLRSSDAGNRIGYSYDAQGQLAAIAANDEPGVQILRNLQGQTLLEQLSASQARAWRYDVAGLPAIQSLLEHGEEWLHTEYEHDAAGNLLQRHDSEYGLDRYEYDQVGRIVGHTGPDEAEARRWPLDRAGNRLQTRVLETRKAAVAGSSSTVDDWSREGVLDSVHYAFDRAGNLARRRLDGQAGHPEMHLEWDAAQRLSACHWQRAGRRGASIHFGYDPLGRRVFKRGPRQTTWFFWDGDTLLGEVGQRNDDGNVVPLWDGNVADIYEARRRQRRLKALHGKVREYVYRPGNHEPLMRIDVRDAPAEPPVPAIETVALHPATSHAPVTAPPKQATSRPAGLGLGQGLRLDTTGATDSTSPPSASGDGRIGVGLRLGAPPARLSSPPPLRLVCAETTPPAPAPAPSTDPASHASIPSGVIRQRTVYHFINDPNGCPVRIVDSEGHVVWGATHTPWGGIRALETGRQLDNPLRQPGQYHDVEIGLSYNLARYYDPHAGCYVSADPLGLAAGENTYLYAFGNPLTWCDPWGLGACRRGEWLFPEGRSHNVNDYDTIYTNGIAGNRDVAQAMANANRVAYYYNPSFKDGLPSWLPGFLRGPIGGIGDVFETGVQKFGKGRDPLTQGFVDGLKQLDHPVTIVAHSQGTATTVRSASHIPAGSTVVLRSPAISYPTAQGALDNIGLQQWTYIQPVGDIAPLYASSGPGQWVSQVRHINPFKAVNIHNANGLGLGTGDFPGEIFDY